MTIRWPHNKKQKYNKHLNQQKQTNKQQQEK